jgi:hypothetical protein
MENFGDLVIIIIIIIIDHSMLDIFKIDNPVEKHILKKKRVQDRKMVNTKELIPTLQHASYML